MKNILIIVLTFLSLNVYGQSLSGQPELAKKVRQERMIIRTVTGSNTIANLVTNISTKNKVEQTTVDVKNTNPEMWLCNRQRGVGYSGTKSGGYNTLPYIFRLFLQ